MVSEAKDFLKKIINAVDSACILNGNDSTPDDLILLNDYLNNVEAVIKIMNNKQLESLFKYCAREKCFDALFWFCQMFHHKLSDHLIVSIIRDVAYAKKFNILDKFLELERFNYQINDYNLDYLITLDLLDWYYSHRDTVKMNYTCTMVDNNASIKFIDWFFSHPDLEFKYSCRMIDTLSYKGHIEALDWCYDKYKSALIKFEYSENAINGAIQNGYINPIKWWLKHSDEFELTRCHIH